MSSRVQKGNTIFRPVAKARSRAPTAPPSQSSSGTQDLPSNFEDHSVSQLAPPPSTFLPIPSTTVPGREPQKQTLSGQSETIVVLQQPPQNPIQGPPTLARESSFHTTPIHSHTPPVLINTSNLPPALINVGRSTTDPVDTMNTQPCQDNRPSVIFPHHFNIPTEPLTPGPSQQDVTVFTPSAPNPTELQNTLVHVPSFDNFQQFSAPDYAPQHHLHEDEIEKPKRKRKTHKTHSDGEMDEGTSNRRTRSRSTTPRQRRSRGPSLPPFDPDADPGEDIDPTIVTMATLCSDTGQGRVSSKAAEILSNHTAWKARNKERRARMKALMEAKKYGREIDEDTQRGDGPSNPLAEVQRTNGTGSHASTNTSGADEVTGIDYSQQLETSRYNVQVRIGPSGETIIDEESLVVDRAENEDTSNYTHVVESDHTKFVNSGTYGKRYRGSRWSAEETELFYNALSQYGENYELIAYVLPGRDRKSCKNKFKAEDKKNHARINYCLNNRIPVDMKTLERMTGKDFSGPVPEIRPPPPPPVIQADTTQESESVVEDAVAIASSKQAKRRSRSRTAGQLEEGVVIVGDVDSVSS